MADTLTEYEEALKDVVSGFGADPGWVIALWKERGVIPDEAHEVSVVFSANNLSIYWFDAFADAWVKVDG